MKILEIKNLQFSYPNKQVFKNLNLTIEEKTITTIVGNNKSGKTTLIKLICGLLDSNDSIIAGYTYIDSKRIYDNSKLFGVVFSNTNNKFLFTDVYKEMAFPLENLNYSKYDIEKRIITIAKEFGNTKILDKKTDDLTNSEKQELLIMIALLHEPKILLLDNSFSMMDKNRTQKIIKILKNYTEKKNLTVILTTTNLEHIINSDYTYILNKGNIVMEGKPNSILKEDTILNRAGLELPFMIDLSLKLEFYELINEEYTDMDRLVNTLWK